MFSRRDSGRAFFTLTSQAKEILRRIDPPAANRGVHLLPLIRTLCSVLAAALTTSAQPTRDLILPTHLDWRRQAEGSYKGKNFIASREAWAAALKLRPDSPRYLHNLAGTQALTGQAEAAIATLRRLAAMGVATRVESDDDFALLRERADFRDVCAALERNRQPQGAATVAFEFPGEGRLIEGIAYRASTGEFFFGDVHQRAIWRRSREGEITRFDDPRDRLPGNFGLALDEKRGVLWAAGSTVPETRDRAPIDKGFAVLSKFDLSTGRLERHFPIVTGPHDPREHVLGDLVALPDGTAVLLTESTGPNIWRYDPAENTLRVWLEYSGFSSLQGLALVGDSLIVSDYANGLFVVSLSPAHPSVRALLPPADATLLGLDGLVAVPGGLIAVQNGVTPSRLLHIALSPDLKTITKVTVLAAALPKMTDLSLVTLVNGRPTFIANAGWDSFDPVKQAHPPARPVYIFQTAAP